tara:strand:+ start:7232 stop:8062 length:831 start_codon:yes stop_codon:yes gene_type:complete
MADTWRPAEPDIETIRRIARDPMKALADLEIPACVFRGAYPVSDCDGLIDRFIQKGLIDDPKTWDPETGRKRIDIGSSLAQKGNNQDAFFAHAAGTHELYETLFDGFVDPVETLYDGLSALASDKKVVTAYEPDGRRYGPAIFRIHYEGHRYAPHIDHVTLREKRFDFAVTRFTHQFAGVLVMRNTTTDATATQSILHRCPWTPAIHPHLRGETFYEYAAAQNIESVRVDMNPGDLYFFNTGAIHEVPALEGDDARVVLAVFVGYSEDDDEVFVWS